MGHGTKLVVAQRVSAGRRHSKPLHGLFHILLHTHAYKKHADDDQNAEAALARVAALRTAHQLHSKLFTCQRERRISKNTTIWAEVDVRNAAQADDPGERCHNK